MKDLYYVSFKGFLYSSIRVRFTFVGYIEYFFNPKWFMETDKGYYTLIAFSMQLDIKTAPFLGRKCSLSVKMD